MVLGLGIPTWCMMAEPGSLGIAHSYYRAVRKNRLHIPDMSRGSLKTLQTEKRPGNPGCRPAEVNAQTGRCRDAGVTDPNTTSSSEHLRTSDGPKKLVRQPSDGSVAY